jgi:hypothetical protein
MERLADHWIEFGQLVIALGGVGFVIKQLFDVQESLDLQNKNLQAQTLATIYREYFRVCREVVKRPHLRAFLYEGLRLDAAHKADDTLRAEVTTICELMTGVLEQAAVQRKNLPREAWLRCWRPFVREMYRNPASEFAEYYRKHRHFYATCFKAIVDPLLANSEVESP